MPQLLRTRHDWGFVSYEAEPQVGVVAVSVKSVRGLRSKDMADDLTPGELRKLARGFIKAANDAERKLREAEDRLGDT